MVKRKLTVVSSVVQVDTLRLWEDFDIDFSKFIWKALESITPTGGPACLTGKIICHIWQTGWFDSWTEFNFFSFSQLQETNITRNHIIIVCWMHENIALGDNVTNFDIVVIDIMITKRDCNGALLNESA